MFPFGDNPSFKKPPFQLYDQIQNPITSESPFFSNFPSPFFDEHELPLHQILPKPTIPTLPPSSSSDHPQKTTKKDPKQKGAPVAPRKRTGKKDRHSKICTAQGIRDRRMRLSLQVARKFFDLQDMLGYDKASKTIEWLFTKSKKAIKDLTNDVQGRGGNTTVSITISDGNTESFVSECEVVSGSIEENCSNNDGLTVAAEEDEKPRKTANTRESRGKARERARSRTEEKMMGKRVESSPNRNVLEKLGSSSSTPLDYAPFVELPSDADADAGTIEKLLGNSCCIDPTTSFMGFLGNWDLLTNDRLNYGGNPNSIYSATTTPDFPLFHQ